MTLHIESLCSSSLSNYLCDKLSSCQPSHNSNMLTLGPRLQVFSASSQAEGKALGALLNTRNPFQVLLLPADGSCRGCLWQGGRYRSRAEAWGPPFLGSLPSLPHPQPLRLAWMSRPSACSSEQGSTGLIWAIFFFLQRKEGVLTFASH